MHRLCVDRAGDGAAMTHKNVMCGKRIQYRLTSGFCSQVYNGVIRAVRYYQLGTKTMYKVEWLDGAGTCWLDAKAVTVQS